MNNCQFENIIYHKILLFSLKSINVILISDCIFRNIVGQDSLIYVTNFWENRISESNQTLFQNNFILFISLSKNDILSIEEMFGNVQISLNIFFNVFSRTSVIFLANIQNVLISKCKFYSNTCFKGTIFYESDCKFYFGYF